MANLNHVKNFRRGVETWNRWRRKNHSVQPDLSHADLRQASFRSGNLNNANLSYADLEGANFGRAFLEAAELQGATPRRAHFFGADLGRADLSSADLVEAQLWHAHLGDAVLRGAQLRGADLRHADVSGADLRDADLAGANLFGVHCFHTDLRRANLEGAQLERARLWDCRLEGADLSGASIALTNLNGVDLSHVEGLASVRHDQASSVGIDTLDLTAIGLLRDPSRRAEVETFLRHAGVRESYLDLFRSGLGASIELYSAYIRYSQADHELARRLHDGLQARGVRCWLNAHAMLPGDDVDERIEPGPWDRILLCCSEASCHSWWMEGEIEHALAKQRQLAEEPGTEAEVLIPLSLDGASGSGEQKAWIEDRLVADFSGTGDDESAFARQLERVVLALRLGSG